MVSFNCSGGAKTYVIILAVRPLGRAGYASITSPYLPSGTRQVDSLLVPLVKAGRLVCGALFKS